MTADPQPSPPCGPLQEVLDAIPSMVLVVDADARIRQVNAQARERLGPRLEDLRQPRTGAALRCLHAAVAPDGCGHGGFCLDCVLNNAVILAEAGFRTRRQPVEMVLLEDERPREVQFLVSASPLRGQDQTLALLLLEPAGAEAREPALPCLCMDCHRVRGDQGAWVPLADFSRADPEADLAHGCCLECLVARYPKLRRRS